MYPHIATTDGKASINATWLRSLNNRNYHFTEWENEKAFKAVIGPRGEKAIINGDILPSPAGVPVIVLFHFIFHLFIFVSFFHSPSPAGVPIHHTFNRGLMLLK